MPLAPPNVAAFHPTPPHPMGCTSIPEPGQGQRAFGTQGPNHPRSSPMISNDPTRFHMFLANPKSFQMLPDDHTRFHIDATWIVRSISVRIYSCVPPESTPISPRVNFAVKFPVYRSSPANACRLYFAIPFEFTMEPF